MTEEKKKPRAGIKPFTKAFWALSRVRQEAFLKNLYELSPENKALFKLRLGEDQSAVFEELKKEIHKETILRMGRFRKIRLSKINTILRNAEKYALPILQKVELKKEVWRGMLTFIISKKHLPDRYEAACARHLDQYLTMVTHHVLETSEVEDILAKEKEYLIDIFSQNSHLPHMMGVYTKFF